MVDEDPSSHISWQRALIVVAEVAEIDMATVSLARWRVEGEDINRLSKGNEATLREVAANWASDEWVQKNSPMFDHLAKRWPKYADANRQPSNHAPYHDEIKP